jgi:hypothetical protein
MSPVCVRVCGVRWRGACKVFRTLAGRQGQGSPVCNLSGLCEPLTNALAISLKRAVAPSSVLLEGYATVPCCCHGSYDVMVWCLLEQVPMEAQLVIVCNGVLETSLLCAPGEVVPTKHVID